MSEMDKQGSIFQEMIERRSRSEELNALAVSQGLPAVVSNAASQASVDDESDQASPTSLHDETASSEASAEEIAPHDSSPIFEDIVITPLTVAEELPAEEVEEPTASGYFDSIGMDDSDAGEEISVAASVVEDEDASIDELRNETELVGAEEPLPAWESEEEMGSTDSTSIFEDIEKVPMGVAEELPTEGIEEPAAPGYFDSIGFDDGDTGEEIFVAGPVAEADDTSLGEGQGEPESVEAEESLPALDSVEEIPVEQQTEVLKSVPEFEEAVSGESMAALITESSDSVDDLAPSEEPVAENEEVSPSTSAAEPEPEGIESDAPVSIEDEIDESDEFLPPEPEGVFDAEVMMAAEELVNRIGPVVDIQSLPKTQPMRVLSKAAKAAEEEANPTPAPAAPAEVEKEKPAVAKVDSPPSKTEEKAKPKPKKKRVSLLDSYFKGL